MGVFVSRFGDGELVVTDGSGFAADRVGDAECGRGYIRRDFVADPLFSSGRKFDLPLIPRSEWRERIKDQEAGRFRPSDAMRRAGVPVKNQRSTSYCWVFAATSCVEQCRALAGLDFVSLSPASVGGPIKDYRNQGGWPTQAIRYIGDRGICPSSVWPDCEILRSLDDPESRALRQGFRLGEWLEFGASFDALATCLLLALPVAVGYNWWSHAVVMLDLVALDGQDQFGTRGRNSWGPGYGDDGFFVLTGSKMFPGDGVAATWMRG